MYNKNTVFGFHLRMQDEEWRNKVFKKLLSKTTILKYQKDFPLGQVIDMGLELTKEQPKEESDLNEEEIDLLTDIVYNKYAIGAFSGMVFNKVMEHEDQCPKKIVEKAVRTRKLIQDMAR